MQQELLNTLSAPQQFAAKERPKMTPLSVYLVTFNKFIFYELA